MKKRIGTKILFILFAAAIGLPGCEWEKKDPEAVAAATKEAKKWLILVDTGNYLGSYSISDTYLKDYFKSNKWQEYLLMYRMPLGEMKDRRIKKQYFSSSIPGLIQGEFYIFEYETDFTRHDAVPEKLTLIRGSDGRWRVGGYRAEWRVPTHKVRKVYGSKD